MKFLAVFAFVAVLGMGSAAPTRTLHEDLMEFVALIPVEEMREIARRYIANDAEVQQALAYLQGPEWAKLVEAVAAHPSWQKFKSFMSANGIDVDAIIAMIHDIIAGAGSKSADATTRGVREFVDELLAKIPKEKLILLLNDKLTNSADFQAFWVEISSEDAHQLVEDVRAIPEVQRVAEVLRGFGIDIDKVINIIYELFGWE